MSARATSKTLEQLKNYRSDPIGFRFRVLELQEGIWFIFHLDNLLLLKLANITHLLSVLIKSIPITKSLWKNGKMEQIINIVRLENVTLVEIIEHNYSNNSSRGLDT